MEDKTSVSKANEYTPEYVAENSSVGECDHEREMGDVEILAPKYPVSVGCCNHQKAESMRWANNAYRKLGEKRAKLIFLRIVQFSKKISQGGSNFVVQKQSNSAR